MSDDIEGDWRVDPTARNQRRFWDGEGWTDRVSSYGVRSIDPYDGSVGPAVSDSRMGAASRTPSSAKRPRRHLVTGRRVLGVLIVLALGIGAWAAIDHYGDTPADPLGAVTQYGEGMTPGSHPTAIAAGPDGNLWFTEQTANRIGKISPGGQVTEYTAGISPNSAPSWIAAGPDGNLWFTEFNTGRVAKITPGGLVTEFPASVDAAEPGGAWGITAGPDGNLWYTEAGVGRVAKITPSGVVTEYSLGDPASRPYGITAGSDGNLWVAEEGIGRIAKVTPAGTVTEYDTAPTLPGSPFLIAAGPDGDVWFTGGLANWVGKIAPTGAISEVNAAPCAAPSTGIVTGPDDNVWITCQNGTVISIASSGTPTSYRNGITPGSLYGIANGPDDNLWFTNFDAGLIAKIGTG